MLFVNPVLCVALVFSLIVNVLLLRLCMKYFDALGRVPLALDDLKLEQEKELEECRDLLWAASRRAEGQQETMRRAGLNPLVLTFGKGD